MSRDKAIWEPLWAQMVEDLGATLEETETPDPTPAQIIEWALSWLIARERLIIE